MRYLVVLICIAGAANAQGVIRDRSGNVIGMEDRDSSGRATMRDANGNTTGYRERRGNTVESYDKDGNFVGSYTR